ncbi:winged helix-turn-helix transcriptional regulator [Persicitalea jodogahamensis]|uniref:Transcriptional regulator n=1 Tax=Persicitalea jodogahamensis TaxID=402147 RepID=A0A8J3D3K2_9BACT|nr:helix-turn-helix domain-containing protein [Persicitalea jodogahamensis]GHB68446.1 transcriptional regulator [Persicitalea jodogahamensis]
MSNPELDHIACKGTIRAVHDAMDVLGGRWKMHIVASLRYGEKRYSEILKDISGISGKMLSRELRDMEINQLIERSVKSTQPVVVSYELTDYGKTIFPVIESLAKWGSEHRQKIIHTEE